MSRRVRLRLTHDCVSEVLRYLSSWLICVSLCRFAHSEYSVLYICAWSGSLILLYVFTLPTGVCFTGFLYRFVFVCVCY